MAKKRKLDENEKCSKAQKKPRKNTDGIRLQRHDLADPKNKSGKTVKGVLPDIAMNCVLAKRKKKDSGVGSVNGVDKNGLGESGFAVETDKATEVGSPSKRNSCMKRTHQDKVKRKRKKHKVHKSVTVKLPEAPEEISVNWKSLLKVRT